MFYVLHTMLSLGQSFHKELKFGLCVSGCSPDDFCPLVLGLAAGP